MRGRRQRSRRMAGQWAGPSEVAGADDETTTNRLVDNRRRLRNEDRDNEDRDRKNMESDRRP